MTRKPRKEAAKPMSPNRNARDGKSCRGNNSNRPSGGRKGGSRLYPLLLPQRQQEQQQARTAARQSTCPEERDSQTARQTDGALAFNVEAGADGAVGGGRTATWISTAVPHCRILCQWADDQSLCLLWGRAHGSRGSEV